MHARTLTLALAASLCSFASAQQNAVPGLDGFLYDINSPTIWGREGPAYPNGQVGFSAVV